MKHAPSVISALALASAVGCGGSPRGDADASPSIDAAADPDATAPTIDAATATDAAVESFWPTCGTEAIDFDFIDARTQVAVAHDGTMFAVDRATGTGLRGSVIARKRPGMPTEASWLVMSTQQLDTVEGLAVGPGDELYVTGYYGGVHGVFAVDPVAVPTPRMLGAALPTGNYEEVAAGAGALYIATYDGDDIARVDLATGARTTAVAGGGAGILQFVFSSPTTMLVATLNGGPFEIALDPSGKEATRHTITAFGSQAIYKVGIDMSGRLLGQAFISNNETLLRVDPGPGSLPVEIFGKLRWSDFAFGKGALRCDLIITSQNSPTSTTQAGDQTPTLP